MALPDVSRFCDLGFGGWRALGGRLTELDYRAEFARIRAIGGQQFPPLCAPLRRWHVARVAGPVGTALRLFALQEPVPEREACEALGAGSAAALEGAGLLLRTGGELRSVLRLGLYEDLLFFADDLSHGSDAVMGPGSLTAELLRAASPHPAAEPGGVLRSSALELGCGAAVNALSLARGVERVIATDINPRAVVIAAANAGLNGISNVEVRLGDLFESVAGERFDLIIAQPPFVPMPPGSAPAHYLYGGCRGDELALRILAELPRRLAESGRGLMVAELPVFAGDPVLERIHACVGESANVLALWCAGPDLDSYSVGDTAYEHPDFGAAFAEKAVARRRHLDALEVESIACVLVAVERSGCAPGWKAGLEIAQMGPDAIGLDAHLAAFDLLSRGTKDLLAARLHALPGTLFSAGGELVRCVYASGSSTREIALDSGVYRLVQILEAAPTVESAARRFARELRCTPGEVRQVTIEAVEQLLRCGLLEVQPKRRRG